MSPHAVAGVLEKEAATAEGAVGETAANNEQVRPTSQTDHPSGSMLIQFTDLLIESTALLELSI